MMVHVIHDMSVMMTTDKYYYTALNVITSAIARSIRILLTHTYGTAAPNLFRPPHTSDVVIEYNIISWEPDKCQICKDSAIYVHI